MTKRFFFHGVKRQSFVLAPVSYEETGSTKPNSVPVQRAGTSATRPALDIGYRRLMAGVVDHANQ